MLHAQYVTMYLFDRPSSCDCIFWLVITIFIKDQPHFLFVSSYYGHHMNVKRIPTLFELH